MNLKKVTFKTILYKNTKQFFTKKFKLYILKTLKNN